MMKGKQSQAASGSGSGNDPASSKAPPAKKAGPVDWVDHCGNCNDAQSLYRRLKRVKCRRCGRSAVIAHVPGAEQALRVREGVA